MAKSNKERLYIFDTTLRDGEQTKGVKFEPRQKIAMARRLAAFGVDRIEAGFPVASEQEFRNVSAIAKLRFDRPVRVAGLARAVRKDIEAVARAVAEAEHPMIHVFLATSKIHRDKKLKKSPQEILESTEKWVAFAREQCDEVEFSPEDAARTEPDFLAQVVETAINAGATVVNIPDTVGYATPEEFGHLFKHLVANVPNIKRVTLSAHCHNDTGMAAANTVAAVLNGARQVETTFIGLGERTGNCPIEAIVMMFLARKHDLFKKFVWDIKPELLYPTSQFVAEIAKVPIPPNFPAVGEKAFAHSSGVHSDGVRKDVKTYEIVKPSDIGRDRGINVSLSKLAGKAAYRTELENCGFKLEDQAVVKVYKEGTRLSERKGGDLTREDLINIVYEVVFGPDQVYRLTEILINSGNRIKPHATITIAKGEKAITRMATGNGGIDAAIRAINDALTAEGVEIRDINVQDYHAASVGEGADAVGKAEFKIGFAGGAVSAVGLDPDVTVASVRSYINCVNSVLHYRSADR